MSEHGDQATQRNALLEVARYFSKPQAFVSVKDARSHFRDAVGAADEKSVVLTSHGEPQAAIISYRSYETMRQAVIGLLLATMDQSWEETRERARQRAAEARPTTETEVDELIGESTGRARAGRATSARKRVSARER